MWIRLLLVAIVSGLSFGLGAALQNVGIGLLAAVLGSLAVLYAASFDRVPRREAGAFEEVHPPTDHSPPSTHG